MLMNDDHGQSKLFSRRSLLLGGGQGLLLGALVGRMYYLQVLESDRYTVLAEDNRINLRLLPPPRGRIVDRFGVPMAINQQNYRLVLVREQTLGVEETLDALAQIIDLGPKDRQRILRETARKRAFVPVTVRENLTWSEVSRVEVNAPDLPGVNIEVGQTRSYPYANSATQVLGYVAAVSEDDLTGEPLLELPGFRIGKNGIERRYDLELRGSAGNSQVEVNAVGRVIRELSRAEGEPGRELVLTVDAELQNYVHQRLLSERAAAAVVMDIEKGDVLALASVPSYDPNGFAIGMTGKQWRELISDPLKPLNNRATTGLYAPGSTFKMTVALAALEAGVGPGHRVFCPGFYRLGNARFHCWKKHGHGWMDMRNGIKQSCDVYFYEVSRRAGIDRISEMARRLGMGAPVGVDLEGEKGGMVPTRDWKLATFGEPWQGGETVVTAIGQGFILTTPLQLAVMSARLASGRAVRPRLTRGFRDELVEAQAVTEAEVEAKAEQGAAAGFEPLGLPEAHLRIVRDAMDAVVNEQRGTAYGKRIKEEGWAMAGKTGTSQVRRITMAERLAGVTKNEDLPWRRRDHALFVCFAPVHAPRYACAVVVQHGGGGSKKAAPIAKDIMIEVQRRDPSGATALSLAPAPTASEG